MTMVLSSWSSSALELVLGTAAGAMILAAWAMQRRVCDDPDVGWFLPGRLGADTLVVFVHGILGDPRRSWGKLPQLVREGREGLSVLSFGYPSGLLHRADIRSAADSLSHVLRASYSGYNHFVFITHSTGGLVVKSMLSADISRTLELLARRDVEFEEIQSLALRSRQIINIAVPHSGGSRAATALLVPLYHTLLIVLVPCWLAVTGLRAIGLLRVRKGYQCGYNQIVWQLRYGNEWLRQVEIEYRKWLASLDCRWLPRPVSFEVHGSEDTTINWTPNDSPSGPEIEISTPLPNRRTMPESAPYVFRGTHPLVKHVTSSEDAIVRFLATLLARYRQDHELSLALHTMMRTVHFDRDTVPLRQTTYSRIEEAEHP